MMIGIDPHTGSHTAAAITAAEQPPAELRIRASAATAARCHAGRHQATSGGWVDLIWEQEAAGSNPAIPTDISRN
jgi:hypothetical protein